MNQQTLNFSQHQKTLGEIVSGLAAKDGLTFRQITSEFIRESIQSRGFKLPKNESDVMKIILQFYEEKKRETIEFLFLRQLKQSKESQSARFSLSIDEWSSLKKSFNFVLYF